MYLAPDVRVRVPDNNGFQGAAWRYQRPAAVVRRTMLRLRRIAPVLALMACARPLTYPTPVGATVGDPVVVQSGGPDGESPAPHAGGPAVPSSRPVPAATSASMAKEIDLLRDRHLIVPVAG